ARTAFDRARRTHFAQRSTEQAEAKTVKEALVKQAEALADSSDFKQTPKSFRDLMAKWKAAGRAGKSDEEALWSRFKAAQDAFFARLGQENEKTEAEQRENLSKKQALVQRAQALLPLTDLGSAKTTLREIAKEWEGIGPVPRDERAKVEGALRKVEDAVRAAEQEQWRKSDPVARGRAQSTVDQLTTAIDKLRKQLHAAEAAGDERKASEAREAIEARQQWLAQAEAALQEFSG
ncbi:MAG TPA: DUF349 domain-containing protein, partial [Actinobacteria bacterium]|nr:DUF349 domain-containing protein [Actinomycetota bacterium]